MGRLAVCVRCLVWFEGEPPMLKPRAGDEQLGFCSIQCVCIFFTAYTAEQRADFEDAARKIRDIDTEGRVARDQSN